MIRALLTRQAPGREFVTSWRFDEALNPPAASPSPAREPAR
jgi:hypothetical protein